MRHKTIENMTNAKPAVKLTLKQADKERYRKEQAEEICAEYFDLRGRYPDAPAHRIFDTIASYHKMTLQGVRRILVVAGAYTPSKIKHI